MVRYPFNTKAAMSRGSSWVNAMWSAAYTQYAQAVAGNLLTEAAQRARLRRAPERLLEDMIQAGPGFFVNGHV